MQSEHATHAMQRVQRRHATVNTDRRTAAPKKVSTLPATAALAIVTALLTTAALNIVAALPATAADPRVNADPATADEYVVAAEPATAEDRRVATLPATAALSTVSALPTTATLERESDVLDTPGSSGPSLAESSLRRARIRVSVTAPISPTPAAVAICRALPVIGASLPVTSSVTATSDRTRAGGNPGAGDISSVELPEPGSPPARTTGRWAKSHAQRR